MINHWMFRCRDVSRKLSQAMDTRLPLAQRVAIRVHLLMCRYCLRFHRQLHLLRQVSRMTEIPPDDDAFSPTLSDDAKARIKETLQKSQ